MQLPEPVNLTVPSISTGGAAWEFYLPMQPLARNLKKQGHILSADVWLVVQDGMGNLHRQRMQITEVPIWSQGGDPRKTR